MYRTRLGPDSWSSGLNVTIVGNRELLFEESRVILLGNQEILGEMCQNMLEKLDGRQI